MYRCSICQAVSRAGQTLLRHTAYRPGGQVDRELPVCPTCHNLLEGGVPLTELVRRRVMPKPGTEAPAKAAPAPVKAAGPLAAERVD